jgi:tetratricopeptide (TPR) repeat protein
MTSPENIQRGLALFAQAQQLHARKNMAEAATAFQRATALMPDHPQLLTAYGQFAEEAGDFRAAEKIYRRIGELRPDSGFEGRLAIVLFRQQKYSDAVPFFEAFLAQAKQQAAPNADMLHALASSLCTIGRWEDGLATARRAIAIHEDMRYRDTELNALFHLGRSGELDACIDDVLACYPQSREIRSLYALHKLKSGDYANGFRFFSDLRWRNALRQKQGRGGVDAYAGQWDGSVFDGVLIITTEQGLGDEIMLSSMFDDLLACGQRTLIECDERLMPLYQRSYPALQFLPRGQEKNLTFPAGTEIRSITALDLANTLRNAAEKFPARRQWLVPDPARVAAIRAAYQKRWPGKRLVGLSWKSARVMEGGATKNIDITDFAGLLGNRDSHFVNLQYGNIAGDVAALRGAGLRHSLLGAAATHTPDPLVLGVPRRIHTLVSVAAVLAQYAGKRLG